VLVINMNNLEHLLISICLQAVIGSLTGNWWAGAAVCAALWIGREQAQAEYRWIYQFGNGKRENLHWWNAFDPSVWNFHNAFWNLALPIAWVIGAAIFFKLR
jgi:hypothetical protein